jgi:tRNA A37 threonylcarbamoyladenosine modification protein TsaB
MAKMMALATGVKIVPVSTMDTISSNADAFIEDTKQQVNRIATIIDAKRNQFFVAAFEKQGSKWVKTMDDCLMKASDFVDKFAGSDDPVWLLGEGLVYYKDKFAADGIEFMDEKYWPATAAGVFKAGLLAAKEGDYADPKTLTPCYLRRSDAEENLEKRNERQQK